MEKAEALSRMQSDDQRPTLCEVISVIFIKIELYVKYLFFFVFLQIEHDNFRNFCTFSDDPMPCKHVHLYDNLMDQDSFARDYARN